MTAHPEQPVEMSPAQHPRTIGWVGTTALAMGGSNQNLFLLAALIGGEGSISGHGSAAIPLLIVGLLLSWAAAPGWTELVLMWPNRVGGIAAACSEAFRPYNPLLAALTGTCYWWGWVPTCGLTALLSASAIQQWFAPFVSVQWLASGIVACFVVVNLCGIRWVVRLAIPIALTAAGLAFISVLAPVLAGKVDWVQASTFHLTTPFAGAFGAVTSVMAGIYLIGFAAPAFEAALCYVGETIDPSRNVPRAMFASALMAAVYFVVLPVIWLGMFGPMPLTRDLALALGPTFAPVFGGAAKAVAIGFMVFNMFPGTLQPLAGASRTLSQLADDGFLPRALALRNRADVPWVATVSTAGMSIFFLWLGDPVWLIAAANFTYLIAVCMPSLAVWLLRRDAPEMPRPYRARRGMIELGLFAAVVWFISAILGFEQFGITTVVIGLGLAYSGTFLFAWRKFWDRRRAGLPGMKWSLHLTLTGSMLVVLALDAAGYQIAVSRFPVADGPLVSGLEDLFVVVAMLTITVGLVLPGIIAHSVVEVSNATKRLVSGTLLDFSQAMEALGKGNLTAAKVELDFIPVKVRSRDEIGEMAISFNALQREIQRSAIGLIGARESLYQARQQLLDSNRELQARALERSRLIDDLTEARDAAEAANLAKGRFVAKMSHEIRTPMNGVLTTLDILGNTAISSEQRQLMSIIERSGKALLDLTDEVLEYSRLNSGENILDNVEFDLIQLVRNRFDQIAGQASKRQIDFHLTLPADRTSLLVVSDPQQITRVIDNTIANALKFTKQGAVEVQLSVLGETPDSIAAELCVTDTGIGMSDELKLRIFEPFEQANESTTTNFAGAGLGLTIVKKIVDSLGGTITVDTKVGRGTAIRMIGTMAKSQAPSGTSIEFLSQPVFKEESYCLGNKSIILVVEDNLINHEVIAASLTRLGHIFRIVENGAAALAACDEENFCLVLMDCRMPIMDGFEATRALRDRESMRKTGFRIPILAISANAAEADRELCLDSGMDDFIAKPFTLAELKQKIEKWLSSSGCTLPERATLALGIPDVDAPIYLFLDAATLSAFDDLQMPEQPSIVNELIDTFIRTAPQQLQLIEHILNKPDFKGAGLVAHGMKSASSAIGLANLSNSFELIESSVSVGNREVAISTASEAWTCLDGSLREIALFKGARN